jgi:integrase
MADTNTITAAIPKKTKLTDRLIANLRPMPGKRYVVWDTQESGFGVTIQPSGHRSFVVIKRLRNGPPRKVVLQPAYPTLGLAQARSMAVEAKIMLANGVDPVAKRRQEDEERRRQKDEQNRVSFTAVATEFIKLHVVGRNPDDPNLRSSGMIDQAIKRDLLSCSWAKLPITQVTDEHILSTVRGIVNNPKRTKPGQRSNAAARAFNMAKSIFKWAMKKKYGLKSNPCDCIDINEEVGQKVGARTRVFSDDELALFWRASGDLAYPVGSSLRFLLLSGLRLNEAVQAEWSEFNLGGDSLLGPIFTVPAVRMKSKKNKAVPHTVPVTPAIADVLASVPRFADGKFVFSFTGGRTYTSAFGKMKQSIDKAMLRIQREEDPDAQPIPRWTIHDLRRSARSLMAQAGVSDEIAERCLSHKVGSGISQVYNMYGFLPEKRAALESLSALIHRIISGQNNNVLTFPQAVLTAS